MSCQTLTVTTTTSARPRAALDTAARPVVDGLCRVFDFTPAVGGILIETFAGEPMETFGGDQLVTFG